MMDSTSSSPNDTRVREVMTTRVFTLEPEDSIARAAMLFDCEHFHHAVILDRGRIFGVISDRDILKTLSPFLGQEKTERAQDLATRRKRLHQIMTRNPVTIHAGQTVADAARKMLDQRLSCLPVVDDDGALVGILSMRDLIAQVAGASPAEA